MPLIPGELLARAFLTKSLISPSFKGETSNFSSGGCRRLGSLRRLIGVSVSGSVYFFRRCASKSYFGILRTPFFSPSNNFWVNLNGFFFKIAPSFSFLLSTLPCVFCSCNDNVPTESTKISRNWIIQTIWPKKSWTKTTFYCLKDR